MPSTWYTKRSEGRLSQGDILEDLAHKVVDITTEGNAEVVEITDPYAVVLSQECDLYWDFKCRNDPPKEDGNQDKFLADIIVIPAYPAQQVKEGSHLKDILGLTMVRYGSDLWKQVEKNRNERYHFIGEDQEIGIPNLVLDFKRYYTVPWKEVYDSFSAQYLVSLSSLYREDLSRRFANYLSRIGLPEQMQ